ncbi:MAG TPA: alpha-galactosidase, partial [bacterium]|nr:alpha-galactosidase [bacterium]
MAWWRSPAIPAASLVIGNPRMDDPDALLYLKSLAGTLPIMLGDPRQLSKATRAEFKRYADWLRQMQNRYDYMMYRQDLPGLGEPAAGAWDGWARINTDTRSGGIVGVFRHGAIEQSRKIAVPYLDAGRRYRILSAPEGRPVATMSGHELMNKGFTVQGNRLYDGWLFEIRALP